MFGILQGRQEGLTKVFNEAENHKPGTGGVLREMRHMEKEDFFKAQRKNGKLEHDFYDSIHLYICSVLNLVYQWVVIRT